jgi:hypothetical protein
MEPRPAEVRVAFRPTAGDYLAIFQQQTLESRSFVVARYASGGLAVILVTLAITTRGRTDLVAGAAFAVLAVLSIWVAGPALIRQGIANRFTPGATPPEVVYRLDARGVHGKSAWASWEDVTRVKETPEAFFLWMRPGAGAYLPKHAMAMEDVAVLRDLFATNVGDRAQLGSGGTQGS